VGSYTNTKKGRRGEEMKYLALWEYDLEDERALIEKFKTRPESEIKRLVPPYHLGGQTKGFSLYEAENFEQIEKFCHHYAPELNFKIYPIIETAKVVGIREK